MDLQKYLLASIHVISVGN